MNRFQLLLDDSDDENYSNKKTINKKSSFFENRHTNHKKNYTEENNEIESEVNPTSSCEDELKDVENRLNNKWTLYAHYPHDTNWDVDSYKPIMDVYSLDDSIRLTEYMNNDLISNCMLFFMKDNIKPIWEEKENRKGGCITYKILKEDAKKYWDYCIYSTIGGYISNEEKHLYHINGISISPKSNFCILKIWMDNCEYKYMNPFVIKELNNMDSLFKKHELEY